MVVCGNFHTACSTSLSERESCIYSLVKNVGNKKLLTNMAMVSQNLFPVLESIFVIELFIVP